MSKELEALSWLRSYEWQNPKLKEKLDIIETALNDYELMKQTKIIVADKKISDEDLETLKNQRMFVGTLEQCEVKPLFDEKTQKKLKALEIIKEKRVFIEELLQSDDLEEYNDYVEEQGRYDEDKLSQEEYELLKEVLL